MKPSRFDIPIGKTNAVSRAALAKQWQVSDRTARDIIAEMRKEKTNDPYAIVSSSSCKGYWRTAAAPELLAYAKARRSRGKKEFSAANDAERVLQMQGQTSFL